MKKSDVKHGAYYLCNDILIVASKKGDSGKMKVLHSISRGREREREGGRERGRESRLLTCLQAEKVLSLAPQMVHTFDFTTLEVIQNTKVLFNIVFPSEKEKQEFVQLLEAAITEMVARSFVDRS